MVQDTHTSYSSKVQELCCCCCCAQSLSCVLLFTAPWTVARQAPLSMEFSKQEYQSGLPFLLQGIFLTQGSNPRLRCLLHWQACSLPLTHLGSPQGSISPQNYSQNCVYVCVCVCVCVCECALMRIWNNFLGPLNVIWFTKGSVLPLCLFPQPQVENSPRLESLEGRTMTFILESQTASSVVWSVHSLFVFLF